jgi:D-tagatose-1,6-bisphosphate aldolase subunit GatZ/KbaZ
MKNLNEIIKILISRKEQGEKPITLLAVCPNSSAVLEASIKSAARTRTIMLFAATLNQVDFEDSYTGWTPSEFVTQIRFYAEKYHWNGPLYPCLDHGGPWLKDMHNFNKLSYAETMRKVKISITVCIKAGYQLLHIDPTVDRTFSSSHPIPVDLVVDRTVELIAFAEQYRRENCLPSIAYEVGTEEVHGGLVDFSRFNQFVNLLRQQMEGKKLADCWPCFFVAQVGTDLHTTSFNSQASLRLYSFLSPNGSLVKGHYSDWVENPEEYPTTGMGGANVGPEFTAEEYMALKELANMEEEITSQQNIVPSNFLKTLQEVIIESGRWKKWLHTDELRMNFMDLPFQRKEWLFQTGSRYIWTDYRVKTARNKMYENLSNKISDPHEYVVDKIMQAIEKYINAFNLQDTIDILGE